MRMRTGLWSVLAACALALGVAMTGSAGALAQTELAQSSGSNCRVVAQTGWEYGTASIPLQTTVSFGPDKSRLACEVAWQRIESAGEERCASSYSDGSLYRNGQLQPVSTNFSACRCQDGFSSTTCQLSTSVQCSYEVYRTAGQEVCD
ncbi:MAG: hypothetical protein ACFCVH_20735 [Alphaproteobacteria bacterium]